MTNQFTAESFRLTCRTCLPDDAFVIYFITDHNNIDETITQHAHHDFDIEEMDATEFTMEWSIEP